MPEEEQQVNLTVVRDGNFSLESTVVFTTEPNTALGIDCKLVGGCEDLSHNTVTKIYQLGFI